MITAPVAHATPAGTRPERRGLLKLALPVVMLASVSACSSGPSATALANGLPPPSTTIAEAPPEGVTVIRVVNGTFRPANVTVDPETTPIVEWRHEDGDDRSYVVEARDGAFISPELFAGDTFQIDVTALDPGIHRYFAMLGRARIPGSIDTRPAR